MLSTIQHHSDVLTLRIGDDEIHATANHRFYSADRNSWVAAGQLHEGELLQTTSGPASVGVTRESAKRVRVYNLQIEQDSEYTVGHAQIRVHNTYPKDFKPLSQQIADDIGALGIPRGQRMQARRAAFALIDRIGALPGRISEAVLRVHFPHSDVHTLTRDLRGWISIDLVPSARSQFGGGHDPPSGG